MFILHGMLLMFLSIAHAFKSPILTSNNMNVRSKDSADVDQILNRNAKATNGKSLARNKRLRLKDMQGFEALTDSFLGGTVGVMSVAFLLELRKIADERLDGCPYCMGNGEILCGSCFGTGQQPNGACRLCSGRGLIQCINCKGDGRITPILLQSKAVRDPDYATDNIGSGINGA